MKAKNRRAVALVLAAPAPAAKPKAIAKPEPARKPPERAKPPVVVAVSTPAPAPTPTAPQVIAPSRSVATFTLNLVYTRSTAGEDSARLALERAGASLVKVAHVREPHEFDVLYVTPRSRALVQATLHRSGVGRGARLVEVDAILPAADAMLVLAGR